MKYLLSIALVLVLFNACQTDSSPALPATGAASPIQMTLLEASATGIDFANRVPYNDTFNCYTFRNFYNGGGVGLGDVNNDGLLDVFFCGNRVPNRLYLNLGQWKFKDITETCGMGLSQTWTAGVAFADVNGDGWLDIYTCKSGPLGGENRHNELFINAGADAQGQWSGQFSEQSAAWKLDNRGLSTHAAFFDYDRDGDLDCYLLNNSVRSVGGYDYRPGQRNTPDPQGGNKLLRNEGQTFTDVTQAAGIYSSAIGFGLGVTVGDYDRDGWQDLFISNDFFERDYLYHNEGNGKFKEVLTELLPEISKGAMGADMADLNNDGYPEIFVTEMTPPDDARYKTKAAFDDWNTYMLMQQTGYHRQFGRNVLQLNHAGQNFSEIGRMAGVHFTDWSWGALIADFDNDGARDIFVANGIGKDLLDQDYTNFYADPAAVRKVLQDNPGQGIKTLIDKMPSERVANFLFRQTALQDGIPQFENVAAQAGVAQPSFSNGSAYGDLDNDGDLDLLVNNVDMPCFLYRNEAKGQHWLKIRLKGTAPNTLALGAQVTVKAGGQTYHHEVAPMRGFESCVDPRPHFGLGAATVVEQVTVRFPDGRVVTQKQVAADQILEIDQAQGVPAQAATSVSNTAPLFTPLPLPAFALTEAPYSDFDQEPLLFTMYSAEGPKMAVADLNDDGLEDVFVGGPKGIAGQIWQQHPNKRFVRTNQPALTQDANCEDSAAAFFDADGDGDQDLYVGSGSNELAPGEAALQDRLYLNDGKGQFKRNPDALMTGKPFSTACVAPADVDRDGDQDLFVGMRMVPGHYGQNPTSVLLTNDGKGRFTPALQNYPELTQLGMVTDAAWADFDGNGDPDLAVCGEWEPIRVFFNEKGRLKSPAQLLQSGDTNTSGWWNTLQVADLNGDQRPDLVLGNHGLNSRFKAQQGQPLTLYVGDFDQNTRDETLLCQYNGGTAYPVPLRNDLVRQMPILKKKLLQFSQYKEKTIADILSPDALQKALKKEAHTLASCVLLNQGQRQFALAPLPAPAQISPVYAIAAADFNHDGHTDLLLGGNHERCKPETGIYLGSYGTLLLGDGKGQFQYLPHTASGYAVRGSVRAIRPLQSGLVLTGVNGEGVRAWGF